MVISPVISSYDPESLLVGVLGRPHGLAGEILLRTYNEHGVDLTEIPTVILERGADQERRRVATARPIKQGWLLRFIGVESREAAAVLTHSRVRLLRESLPPLAPGEFYVEDLIGCQVVSAVGRTIGLVQNIFWNGAHDVMSVVGVNPASGEGTAAGAGHAAAPAPEAASPAETLVPIVPEFVRSVDAPGRRVIIDWDGND